MAGEGDIERLVVLLEARMTDFERNMLKAAGVSQKNFNAIKKHSKSATRQMEQDVIRSTNRINQALAATGTKIGALGKAAMGGFLGGFVAGGVAGIVSQIGQVANSIAQVGDEAARAGLSMKVFQEWKAVAEDTRIPVDAMIDAFKELNIRADEFATTGKGSAAEAFARIGMAPQEVKERLKDPSDFMLEIIARTKALKDTAAGTRIFDEILGGTGAEQLIRLLGLADGEIGKIIISAHESGRVMDDEMIAKAAELDRRFNAIANTVGTALKSAIVSAADSLVDFINSFRDFENQRSSALEAQVNDIIRQRAGLVEELKKLQTGSDLTDTARDLGFGPATEVAKQQIAQVQAAIDALSAREDEIIGILSDRTSQQLSKPTDRTWTPPKPPPPGTGRGGGGRDKETAQAERQAEAVRRLIAELEEELRLVGASDTQKQISAALRRANVDATSKEGQQIAQLVTQIEAETAALDKQKKAQEARTEALSNMFDMATDGISSITEGSVTAEDALKKLASQLAIAVAQAALLGTGPLAGLFGGGVFAPAATVDPWAGLRNVGYSSGTANTGGQRGQPRGVVHGQEAVIPLPSGGKVPVQMMGGGSGGSPVKVVVNNYGEPADVSVNQRTDADGSRVVEVMLQKKIQDEVTRPSAATNRQLRGAYGLSSQVIRR